MESPGRVKMCSGPNALSRDDHRVADCAVDECRRTGECFFVSVNAEPVEYAGVAVRPVTDFSGQVDGSGYKTSMDDPKKIPLWLVPVALLRAAGRALGYGARKYAANNWRKGMAWSECYSALQRHLSAWLEGEDTDPESGLSHLDHATACLAFLTEYAGHPELYGKFDDRFKRPAPQPEEHRCSIA